MNAIKQAENAKIGTDAGYVCPHCGKTEHTPNAETLAAMQEAEAILRGEIPGAVFIDPRQYQTREELKIALKEAL
jgi:3-mercaptopyruvate sulfurtransferase SseA